MRTLTWTVEFEWEYDLEKYVKETKKFIKEENLSLDSDEVKIFLYKLIDTDIVDEEDYLYYNFDSNQYETIVYQVIDELKKGVYQLALDL